MSHQPYQDLKVRSYVRFAYIQCRLNLFIIRPKRTNRKPQSMVEIKLKVDISHDVAFTGLNHVIKNYDCTLYLRSSYMKILHLSLGSKKVLENTQNCFSSGKESHQQVIGIFFNRIFIDICFIIFSLITDIYFTETVKNDFMWILTLAAEFFFHYNSKLQNFSLRWPHPLDSHLAHFLFSVGGNTTLCRS